MSLPYVLIDFENVQPKVLDRLRPGAFRVKVFLGQHQSKLMLELVQRLQPFGKDAEYIQIHGSGPDAVDFHIAFYIGQLAAKEPAAAFTIVSKDKGFDPLVRHLKQLGIKCERLPELPGPAAAASAKSPATAAPAPPHPKATKPVAKARPAAAAKSPTTKATSASTTRARVKEVVEHLKKSTKPATLAALQSAIKSWLGPTLDETALNAVLQSLRASKKVVVSGTKVSYSL